MNILFERKNEITENGTVISVLNVGTVFMYELAVERTKMVSILHPILVNVEQINERVDDGAQNRHGEHKEQHDIPEEVERRNQGLVHLEFVLQSPGHHLRVHR